MPQEYIKAGEKTRRPRWLMKVNVDAAISKNMGRASAVLAIARDQTGNFLGVWGLVLDGITDPEWVEAIS